MALILVVDDRPGNRDYLVTLLGYRGHRLLEADDGAEALALVRAERPALVITDVLMPVMDGFEFVRRLRADPEVALTPVIFYTAEYQSPGALALAVAGGVHQLIKPAEPEEILRVVERTLGLEPAAAPPPPDPGFEREHLRLLTDSLACRVDLLESAHRRQAVLVDLGQRALAGVELSTLLGDAVRLVTRALGVEYGGALELLPGGDALLLRAGVGWEEGAVGRATVGAGAGSQADFTLLCREAVIVEDLHAEVRFAGTPLLLEHGVTCSLGVVIPGHDRPFGILGAHTARRRDFSREEGEFLQAVANLLAAAIEQRRVQDELRRAESRIQEQYGELDRIYRTAPIGLGLMDRDLRFVRLNERLAAVNGGSVAEYIGQTLGTMIPGLAEEIAAVYEQILDSGEPVLERDFHCVTPGATGVGRDWLMSFHPLMSGDGLVREISVAILDVTERRSAQEAMRVAKEAAEAASRVKGEFLANVTHEMRTPMNAILGLTELTLESELGAEQRENLEIVKSATDSLLSTINDVLDFSKIQAGKLELDSAEFGLRGHLVDILDLLARSARARGLELRHYVDPEVPDRLIGAPARLRQVLVNLVGNAIKFTERGEVIIGVELGAESRGRGDVGLQFRVTDTGIGISADRQAAVFAPFTQADGSTTRRYGGTGLGLAISSQLVGLMGGRIWVESEVGRGSTFHFSAYFTRVEASRATDPGPPEEFLKGMTVQVVDDITRVSDGGIQPGVGTTAVCFDEPIHRLDQTESISIALGRKQRSERPSNPSDPPAPVPAAQPLHILLAEDNPFNQRVALLMLRKLGHSVTMAGNGLEAITALEREPFDLILMDLQMPKMGGIEATIAIRSTEAGTARHLPIIAVTAHTMKEDRDRCMDAGMDDYVTKPIEQVLLRQAIEGCISRTRETAGAKSPEFASGIPMDVDAALGRVDGDRAFLGGMAAMFRDEAPLMLAEVQGGIESADALRTGKAVHTLKNWIDNFVARPAFEAVQALERAAKSNDLESASVHLSALRHQLERLEPGLDQLASFPVGAKAGDAPEFNR